MVKKPTIRDVAKAAGVSIATVSFVLNNRPGQVISEKVKKRVLKAAERLNYHPSATAASLARKRTHNIALLFYNDENIVSNQFYAFVIQGAIKEAMKREYNLFFSFIDGGYSGYPDLPKIIREAHAAGALFIKQIHPKLVKDTQDRGIPVVAIDHYPAAKKLNSLEMDNLKGGALAAEHLLELGHQKIGVMAGGTDRPSVAERVQGFKDRLIQAGLPFTPRGNVVKCDSLDFDSGYQRALRLFEKGTQLTALFCVNDEVAAGVLRAARESGISVPHQLSVVGYDDITMSAYTDPPLTTVGIDKEAMGARAVSRLIELVENGEKDYTTERVDVALTVRRSTAAPPDQRP